MSIKNSRWALLGISIFLAAITWAVFGQALDHEFVNYDDDTYLYKNPNVVHGLTVSGVAWAFTHFDNDNWHPLTSLSHMLDCQLFGLKPGGHHFTNVLLHTIAAVLLFLVLNQMTSALWRSAFVAVVFAIHPLHVESVAWIAERKDVLSAVCFMLTLGAYVYYSRRPTLACYVTISIFFALGLMSKPMFVTVPIVLLLLDYWPLNRFGRWPAIKLVVEKIPFLLLSAAISIATLFAQRKAMPGVELLPFTWRATNALAAYVIYIWQMIWPDKLAVVYPHPGRLPDLQTAGASALLVTITLCVFVLRKRWPYLITGWFWYVAMLLPVIGLVQVGGQAHADRYTYLPQIGLYVAATWGVVHLTDSWRYRREILAIAAAIIIAAFAWLARIQTLYWHDSESLWRHTLAVTTTENDVAHFYLGEFLLDHHRVDEAILEFRTVLARHPDDPDVHFDLGGALLEQGELDGASTEYESALKIDPNDSDAETALASLRLEQGRAAEATAHYRNVLELHPSSALAHYNLAVALHRQGRLVEAIAHYKQALAIQPDYPDADRLLGQALLQNGQPHEARFHLEKR